jgi:hypothetical protein
MAGLKGTRRAAQRAGSRNSQENSDVTPFHRDQPNKTERRECIYVS